MKYTMILSLALVSIPAFSGIELTGRIEQTVCTIKENQVTRVQKFGKSGPLSLTQKFEISTLGLEQVLKDAEAAVTDRPTNPDMSFIAKVDDRSFALDVDDSKAATAVIQMIVKACRFN